jgi:hypothetical protein
MNLHTDLSHLRRVNTHEQLTGLVIKLLCTQPKQEERAIYVKPPLHIIQSLGWFA